MSPCDVSAPVSVCVWGGGGPRLLQSANVQCASKLRNILGEIFLRGVSGGVGKRYFYNA